MNKELLKANEWETVIQLAEAVTSLQNNRKIYGIKGLAEFFQCSYPTACKIGKSGKFPRYQQGQKIFFFESEILSGLSK